MTSSGSLRHVRSVIPTRLRSTQVVSQSICYFLACLKCCPAHLTLFCGLMNWVQCCRCKTRPPPSIWLTFYIHGHKSLILQLCAGIGDSTAEPLPVVLIGGQEFQGGHLLPREIVLLQAGEHHVMLQPLNVHPSYPGLHVGAVIVHQARDLRLGVCDDFLRLDHEGLIWKQDGCQGVKRRKKLSVWPNELIATIQVLFNGALGKN